MDRHFFVLISIGIFGSAFGHNSIDWVFLKSGDKLPHKDDLVEILNDHLTEEFVGRARYYDEILPAKVFANGTAVITCCGKKIFADEFEILTTSNGCEWKNWLYFDADETALRVGTAWDKEPIYVGIFRYKKKSVTDPYTSKFSYGDTYNNYNPIYLTSDQQTIVRWMIASGYDLVEKLYLSCPTETKWVEAVADKLPNGTVSGGKSGDGHDIYVARLRRKCEIVTGQVVPDNKTATAFLNNGEQISAEFLQVLVGEPNEYIWVARSGGEIPDYAVINGKNGKEQSFIARINKTIGHLSYSTAREKSDYEILVS